MDARLLSFACGLEHAKQAAAVAGHAAAQAAAGAPGTTAGAGQQDEHAAAAAAPAEAGIQLAAPLQQAQEQAALTAAGAASGSGQRAAALRHIDSSGSSAPPLAFGSPVVSAMGSDGGSLQPPAISLSASQGSEAGTVDGSQYQKHNNPSLTPWNRHTWLLPFAAGVMAGTTGCCLLLAGGGRQ